MDSRQDHRWPKLEIIMAIGTVVQHSNYKDLYERKKKPIVSVLLKNVKGFK